MNNHSNPSEPVPTEQQTTPPLLTVSQAYELLIAEGLPRSKKTIRKWCRLGHVEKSQNVIPGGAKWLIVKSSLIARIAEERLIDASLCHETGSNPSASVPDQTRPNPSAPVRDDELVEVLKQQLDHEREARKLSEQQNRDLISMYHEIAMASTQVGIEIGKGMQEQGKARRLVGEDEPASDTATTTSHSVPDYTSRGDKQPPQTRYLDVQ